MHASHSITGNVFESEYHESVTKRPHEEHSRVDAPAGTRTRIARMEVLHDTLTLQVLVREKSRIPS